jgi:diacylglycerol kinase (ATP)
MEPIDASTSREFGKNLPEIVLVNPKAGSGSASRTSASWKGRLSPNHTIVSGKEPSETEKLAAQAASDNVPRLIIVGGDGTLHHALNGFLSVPNTATRLAIIASGTANDYAASLRHHAQAQVHTNLKADVGLIRYNNFQRYFLNVAGIGLTAHAALSSRPSPWLPARLRYTLGLMRTLISGWRYTDTLIRLPSQTLQVPQLLTLSVAIGIREGSFPLAPNARLDDGLFNILVAAKLRRRDVLRYLPGLMLGRLPQDDPRIQYLVAPEIQFRSSTPLHLHLDGEIYGDGILPPNCDITLTQPRQIDIELLEPQ